MAPERIPGFRKEMEDLGVPLVAEPGEMIGRVDGMLIESLQGGVHLERARPFLEAGIPCFIDKPFTCGLADAREVAALAAARKVGVFSASSLRYAPELVAFNEGLRGGKLLGAVSYGPAPYFEGNPGLFHYGIHALEVLYTLMGPGCVRLTCTHGRDVDVVTGRWSDGRVATLRGARPTSAYGFLAFTDAGVRHVRLGTRTIYRELLKRVVAFFEEGKAPVDLAVTVEMMAFLEAAVRSAAAGGSAEELGV
jgi:predicted dehydrogenase